MLLRKSLCFLVLILVFSVNVSVLDEAFYTMSFRSLHFYSRFSSHATSSNLKPEYDFLLQ